MQPLRVPRLPAAPLVRGLIGGYALLGVFTAAVWLLPHLSAVLLGAVVLLLALPMTLALWQRGAVRSLARLHRFAPGRWPYRLAVRRILRQVAAAAWAVAVTAGALLQGPLFGLLEWALLAVVPALYVLLRHPIMAHALPLFARRVYAADAAAAIARVLTFCVLCVGWIVGRYLLASAPAQPLAEIAYDLQSRWPHVASAIVRWALDAGAWSQATLATLEHAGSASPWWQSLLALVVLPGMVFGYGVWSVAGMALERSDVRRATGIPLTDADDPPPVTSRRRTAYAGSAVCFAAIVLALVARADHALQREQRVLALRAIPACERIGGIAYAVGTLAAVKAYTSALEERSAGRRGAACARIEEIARIAAADVDAYLDWYFSLGAEWMRLGFMLTGDVETLLEVKFQRMVASDPRIVHALADLQVDQQYLLDAGTAARESVVALLERERLVLSERQCRVVTEAAAGVPLLAQLDATRTRLLASTATGVAAGAFAGAVTARVMSRATMQAAGRVLGKAAAKRGVGLAGSAAAGSAAGAIAGSAVPFIGTLAGALAGLAVGAGVDVAMLSVEEKLTREDMRKDLLAAVDESLAPLRAAFDCPPR